MPGAFTIDFQDRTRASITYEAVAPRSGEAWTEMLYHVAFCVGRALVNLDRDDQLDFARQFDSWLQNDFADFPVHVGPPACLTPCARFVSSFDVDVPSYVRDAYGFGLNARGLDYYGPMAAGVLMRHIRDVWDRPDDLLRPARTLCLRVVADGVDEAGHVQLVTECVTEALEEFTHRRKAASLEQALLKKEALPGRGSVWRRAVAGAGIVLGLGVAVAWHLSQAPVPSFPPAKSETLVVKVEPKTVTEARKAEEQRPAAPAQSEQAEQAVVRKSAPVTEEPKRAEVVPPSKAPLAEEAPRPVPPPVTAPAPRLEALVKPKEAPVPVPPMPDPKPVQEARVVPPSPTPMHEIVVTGRDGSPMALVPSGEFLMGNQAEDDAPPHRVYLDAFYIDRHEVTNGRYLKFVEATRHRAPQHVVDPQYDLWAGTTLSQGVVDLPVVNVDWSDAAAYCRWAGKRLPTEAEWEKAARGTDSRLYPWGNEAPSLARLNFSRRWQGAHTLQPVGNYEAGNSPYGAQDMAGNVWEWVSDWYDAGSYAAGPARNPQGPPSGLSKILRGGSWTNSADTVRTTHRREEDPEMRNSDSGFRCAKDGK